MVLGGFGYLVHDERRLRRSLADYPADTDGRPAH
jgi:hypothetical protein